eukprot:14609277-Alexandrium_andersonii.AAC.1
MGASAAPVCKTKHCSIWGRRLGNYVGRSRLQRLPGAQGLRRAFRSSGREPAPRTGYWIDLFAEG